MSIWERRVDSLASRKSEGTAAPAIAQIMSGGSPWFHVVTSERRSVLDENVVTSVEMTWKRWILGCSADAWYSG